MSERKHGQLERSCEICDLEKENKRINDEYLALLEWICGNLTVEQVNEATTYVLTKRNPE